MSIFDKDGKVNWASLKRKIVPTDRDLAHEKGDKFVADLMAGYSIAEQSEVILKVRETLKEKRTEEIKEVEDYLALLKKDLTLLESQE